MVNYMYPGLGVLYSTKYTILCKVCGKGGGSLKPSHLSTAKWGMNPKCFDSRIIKQAIGKWKCLPSWGDRCLLGLHVCQTVHVHSPAPTEKAFLYPWHVCVQISSILVMYTCCLHASHSHCLKKLNEAAVSPSTDQLYSRKVWLLLTMC